jgi:hypothetical protein
MNGRPTLVALTAGTAVAPSMPAPASLGAAAAMLLATAAVEVMVIRHVACEYPSCPAHARQAALTL